MKDAAKALLWIDDGLLPDNASVQLLERAGYRVHCAVTGTAGLAMTRTGQYDGILLDLRLPDIPGLAVLATLRAESINTPVMVLTAFGEANAEFAARRFGADAFEYKPLFGDDLPMAVERFLGREGFAGTAVGPRREDVLPPEVRVNCLSIAALLKGLHRLSRSHPVAAGPAAVDIRESVKTALVRALADSNLPMPLFVACAAALKSTMDVEAAAGSWRDWAGEAEETIHEALSRRDPSDSRVVSALAMVEEHAAQRKRLKREDAARIQGVDASHLSRLVRSETGFEFTAWRTAHLLRPSLRALAETNEHVQQIACRLLRFSDETQFTHEFHRMFGLSPTEFRQSWKSQAR